MPIMNKKQLSAVSMYQYGVSTIVLTEHKNLSKIEEMFTSSNDSQWMDGKGKKYLHSWLKVHLLKEDKYFTQHTGKADVNNERWVNFCDDCVNFAVLTMLLYETPIHLVHPSQYGTMFKNSTPKGTRGEMPTLIEGINCVMAD
jgi:hypothetical protein